jgi:selenocysteine lyase/cysteine desulfurase
LAYYGDFTTLTQSDLFRFEERPAFLSIAALEEGFKLLDEVGMRRLNNHVLRLTAHLLNGLRALEHRDAQPLVRVHGPTSMEDRGPTITFNVLDRTGHTIPYWNVEARAREEGVSLRGGCFCNPGASEYAFGFRADETSQCLNRFSDSGFTIERFAQCLGRDVPVGAVRISLGLASNLADIDRALSVVQSYSTMVSANAKLRYG